MERPVSDHSSVRTARYACLPIQRFIIVLLNFGESLK